MKRVDYVIGHATSYTLGCLENSLFVFNEVDYEKAAGIDDSKKLLYVMNTTNNIPEAHRILDSDFDFVKENSLLGISGSCHPALHFLHITGVDTINLVGFDGNDDESCKSPHFDYAAPSRGGVNTVIYNDLMEFARLLKLKIIRHLSVTVFGKKEIASQEFDWRENNQ